MSPSKGKNTIFGRFFSLSVDSHPKNVEFQVCRSIDSYIKGALCVCILGISGRFCLRFSKFVQRSIDYLCHKIYLSKRIYQLFFPTTQRPFFFSLSHFFVLYLFFVWYQFCIGASKRTQHIEHFNRNKYRKKWMYTRGKFYVTSRIFFIFF